MKTNDGVVNKNWGYELIWTTNDLYCGKLLCYPHPGSTSSMHFHKDKKESWFVLEGQFKLRFVDTKTGALKERMLKEGDVWHNEPLQPHQLTSLTANGTILEVSTRDDADDTYRIAPGTAAIESGDSQINT